VQAFLDGQSFAEALDFAAERGEGAVPQIKDLFIDKGFADDLVFADRNGGYFAIPIWDTHGYFRFVPESV
jgi:hypothetical protein